MADACEATIRRCSLETKQGMEWDNAVAGLVGGDSDWDQTVSRACPPQLAAPRSLVVRNAQ